MHISLLLLSLSDTEEKAVRQTQKIISLDDNYKGTEKKIYEQKNSVIITTKSCRHPVIIPPFSFHRPLSSNLSTFCCHFISSSPPVTAAGQKDQLLTRTLVPRNCSIYAARGRWHSETVGERKTELAGRHPRVITTPFSRTGCTKKTSKQQKDV